MARPHRASAGGFAYHVMNRSAGGVEIFSSPADYQAFERTLAEARQREPVRMCAYALMPNHFHLVLWPRCDKQLSSFMQWLSMTHTQRYRTHRHTVGSGHLYQSRFKSFPIQEDDHFLTVCRYVERNPLRAHLVEKAQDWPWGSLGCRAQGLKKATDLLDDWPVLCPQNWVERVNRLEHAKELAAVRYCALRGRPFGDDDWSHHTARRLDLQSTLRRVGRPKKASASR